MPKGRIVVNYLAVDFVRKVQLICRVVGGANN